MEIILLPILNTFVMVYIDDIIIFSETLTLHIEHLREVFELLKKAGMKVKIQKCRFAQKSVEYLGHIVSAEGIKADPKKLLAVRNFSPPKNLNELRSFLGLANYYRRFIANFANLAHALKKKFKKAKSAWKWGPEEQTCFEAIKQLLCSSPVLAHPNFELPFIVHTDASGYGVGGVLSQIASPQNIPTGTLESPMSGENIIEKSPDDRMNICLAHTRLEHPIAYTSKHLTDAQAKWCTTEKEAYAIIHSVKVFFHFLIGTTFTIVTDHAALEYIMKKRESTGRLT